MKLSSYGAYCLYVAIIKHFSSQFDYFKYNGKIRKMTKAKFDCHQDRFAFEKIAEKYDEKDLIDYYVGNVLVGHKYIRDFHENLYFAYIKRKQSLTYHMINEIDAALSTASPKELFAVQKHEYPKIIITHLAGDVSIETLTVLDHYLGFIDRLDNNDPLIVALHMKTTKLYNFLEYDNEKIEKFLTNSLFKTDK